MPWLVDEFASSLTGVAPATVVAYRRDVASFVSWAERAGVGQGQQTAPGSAQPTGRRHGPAVVDGGARRHARHRFGGGHERGRRWWCGRFPVREPARPAAHTAGRAQDPGPSITGPDPP